MRYDRVGTGRSAVEAIGRITKDISLFAVTKGHFSLMEVIETILDQVGPARLVIIAEAARLRALLENSTIQRVTLLTDASFPARHPTYAKAMVEAVGEQNIIASRCHAKFLTVRNDEWDLLVLSSMNLNVNPRLEHFHIQNDPGACQFVDDLVVELDRIYGRGAGTTAAQRAAPFNRIFTEDDDDPWATAIDAMIGGSK